ncbi:MAG: acyltransferase domain-containing protein [Burkholderiales bacterium]|nr:acyltransferase domain-containing protein [Burkholderiales bacterium]
MSIMLMCPGQGSQHPQMFVHLANEPEALPILEIASRFLDTDVRHLHLSEKVVDLNSNRVAQLLITAHCLAVRAVLGEKFGEIFVGYSVGEIAAIACAGCVDDETAFALVEERVRCMDNACRNGGVPQGMLAVVGMLVDEVAAAASEIGVAVAIINGRDHVVVGGPAERVEQLAETLLEQGVRTVRLPVRVASHTPFIKDAGTEFEAVVRAIQWRSPHGIVLSGIDGRQIRSLEDAAIALSQQLWRTLNFARCVEIAAEHGATCALEIGPGNRLARLTSEILPKLQVRAYEDFRSAEGLRQWLNRTAG